MAVPLAGDEVAEGQRCMREGELEPSCHGSEPEDQCERVSSWNGERCSFSLAVEQRGIQVRCFEVEKRVPPQTVSFEILLYGSFYLFIPTMLIISCWVRCHSRPRESQLKDEVDAGSAM